MLRNAFGLLLLLSLGAATSCSSRIESLGGKVERDKDLHGNPIVALRLTGDQITDDSLYEATQLPHLRKLVLYSGATGPGLNFSGEPRFSETGWNYLPALHNLKTLHLTGGWVNDDRLVQVGELDGLQDLKIVSQNITDDGLANLSSLKELESVDLWASSVTDAGIIPLLENNSQLHSLDLFDCPVTDQVMPVVAGLKDLEQLGLEDTDVTDAGLIHLVELTHLRRLRLGGSSQITNAGMPCVGKLTGLEILWMRYCRITDAGMKDLKGLKSLQVIDMYGSDVTPAGIRDNLPADVKVNHQ